MSLIYSGVKRAFIVLLLLLILPVSEAFSKIPVVKVRFANPVFEENTMTYRLDVEFQSDQPGLELFGINVRFLYDDALIQFQSFDDFAGNYGSLKKPQIKTGLPSSGADFSFKGAAGFVNGIVQLKKQSSPLRLTSTDWTRLFNVSFRVQDPDVFIAADENTPFLIWDLKPGTEEGGYLRGDDGVVITAVDPSPEMESAPVLEALGESLLVPNSVTTRIKNIADEFHLNVWPNPTTGPVNIDMTWKGVSSVKVKVTNVLGSEIFNREYPSGENIKFDLSGAASGQYMVEMSIGETRFLQKLVLDRK